MDLSGGGDWTGEVRNDADVVRLAQGADADQLGDAADVRQRAADEIEVVVLHQLVEVPPRPPFLARGQRHAGQAAQFRNVLKKRIGLNRILDEIRIELFDHPAAAERVGEGEPLVEVDHEVPARTNAFAGGAAVGLHLAHAFAGVVAERARRQARSIEPEQPPAGLHARGGAVAQRVAAAPERRRVTLQIIAVHAAEQLVHRHAQRLAFQIPQRQIERTDRMQPFASGRIVEGAVHVLPQSFDVERVLADEPPGAWLQRVARPAFADAGDVGVGLDGDDHVALQQRNLQRHHVGRLVEPDPRDLRLRQRGLRE